MGSVLFFLDMVAYYSKLDHEAYNEFLSSWHGLKKKPRKKPASYGFFKDLELSDKDLN